MAHLFRPLCPSEVTILKKFEREATDRSLLDVLNSNIPLPAAFVDFTISLIQQNVESTRLIGSHNRTEAILKLDLEEFASKRLKIDWTKEYELILLFHAVSEQWITFSVNLNEKKICAIEWQDQETGGMCEETKKKAINKIRAVITMMAKKSKKELKLEVVPNSFDSQRSSKHDFFMVAAISTFALAGGYNPSTYYSEYNKITDGRPCGEHFRERILFEYVQQKCPDVALFVESKRKESKDNMTQGGDEHGPKPKRRKTATDSSGPNYLQLPSITQKTSVDQKHWVQQSLLRNEFSPNDRIAVHLSIQSFQTLKPGIWIGDEVISMFMLLLDRRDAKMHKNEVLSRRSHFCQSYFLHLFRQNGLDFVERYAKTMVKRNIIIFDCDKVYVPVHISNCHWGLVMASIQEKKIEYYDSLGYNGDIHMKDVMEYLFQHHTGETRGAELVPAEWKMRTAEVPKQYNSKGQGAGVQIIAS
jgi:hypothetical protein